MYPLVRQAYYDRIRHDLPMAAYKAYVTQYNKARQRGIEFTFTFREWWAWWQTDHRWSVRGRTKGCLMMARIGDEGPYAPGNVYAATHIQNAADRGNDGKTGERMQAWWDARTPEERAQWHLAVRGDGHPKSRAVIDPYGVRYGSAALAADAHGCTRQNIAHLARGGRQGWHWENEADRILADGATRVRGGVSP